MKFRFYGDTRLGPRPKKLRHHFEPYVVLLRGQRFESQPKGTICIYRENDKNRRTLGFLTLVSIYSVPEISQNPELGRMSQNKSYHFHVPKLDLFSFRKGKKNDERLKEKKIQPFIANCCEKVSWVKNIPNVSIILPYLIHNQ